MMEGRNKGDEGLRDGFTLNLNLHFALVGFVMPVTSRTVLLEGTS
jgi:hypothetical protein